MLATAGEYKSSSSNQLTSVTDSPSGNDAEGFIDSNKLPNEYNYDLNGNLKTDANKNITDIVYNHLNLPTKITFGATGNIVYIYNATGQKLEKIVTKGTTVTSTNYLGGYQYTKPNLGTWALQFFPTAEGYVKHTAGSYSYVFNYTDHLGNVRVSYEKDPFLGSLKIIDESHYYPFGLKHVGYVTALGTDYKYKYNGKELQDELGLNMTAMDYRQYDPALGRFNSLDVLCETTYSISPYRFAFNNPVYWSDPTGLFETRKEARQYRREQNLSGRIQKDSNGVYSINDKKNSTSYFKPSSSDAGLVTVNDNGVATSPLVSKENEYSGTDGTKDGLSIFGGAKDLGEELSWNKMATSDKSKIVYDFTKYMKGKGFNIPIKNSTLYNVKIPKGLKYTGYGLAAISTAFTVADIADKGEIRASHVLDVTITGLSLIPGGGWIVGLTYFGADSLTRITTGKSIGAHLDEAVEENFDRDNGMLINLK